MSKTQGQGVIHSWNVVKAILASFLVFAFTACSEGGIFSDESAEEGVVQESVAPSSEETSTDGTVEIPSDLLEEFPPEMLDPDLGTAEFTGAFRLQSVFRGEQECLDANHLEPDTTHGGAFMAPCDGSEDQIWWFTEVEPDHHQIWSKHDDGELCLDGNDRSSAVHDGAAFVDQCRLIAGQVWTVTEAEDGAVRLHTMLREHSACLESNSPDSAVHSGAAFMDNCAEVTGQWWQLVIQASTDG